MEISNARFDGEYKICGETVAANPFLQTINFLMPMKSEEWMTRNSF
jgi:hypothetical protein